MKKYIIGGILVVAALYLIKVKVSSAQGGTLTDKWIKKHPKSVDSTTANRKVPLILVLLNWNTTSRK